MSGVAGSVVLAGAFDTKGDEYGFVRDRLAAAGVRTILLDTGVLGTPKIAAEIDRRAVARAGGANLEALAGEGDRSTAMVAMARGAASIVRELYDGGRLSALMVLGGSNAGYLMSRLAPELPIGCPKLLVSTIVAGDTRPYVGASDLTMIYPVVDIAGLNSVSSLILARAADACAGMVQGGATPARVTDAVSVACSMFGVTTQCVTAVHDRLATQGREVQIFHANGTGGRTLETMIRSGLFAAVADITTTELADELLGGVCSAGPHRLEAATACGVPQVVSAGALDMVNFGTPASVPERFAGRRFHAHNPNVTLMRTNEAECAELGSLLAGKLNGATSFTEVHIPAGGFSQISTPGGPFHDPAADSALIEALRASLDPKIPLHVHDLAINDPDFALEVTDALTRGLSIAEGSRA